jgi:hypothetical protein
MNHCISGICLRFGMVLLLGSVFSGSAISAFPESITVGTGSLRIGGNFQTTFSWYEDDAKASEFQIQRARLMLHGMIVPDKIGYFVQGDMKRTPYLLDTRLMLYYIPNTEVYIGRFVPKFTLYMPHGTTRMDFVNYPLTTSRYAMWRQMGVQFNTQFDSLNLYYGVFNGYGFNPSTGVLEANDWGDSNDAKDFLLSAIYQIREGMRISAGVWLGRPVNVETGDDFDAIRYGVFFDWRNPGFHVAAEFVAGEDRHPGADTVSSYAALLQGSLILDDNWEILFRYDEWNPNTEISDNDESWFTAGINYSLEGLNTKFFLNYIARMQDGKSMKDDEIVLQAQFSF